MARDVKLPDMNWMPSMKFTFQHKILVSHVS